MLPLSVQVQPPSFPAEWLAWMTPLGLMVTLIAAAAGAVGYFRSTSVQATVKVQSQTITSYEQRLAQVEAELVHYKADSIAKTAENEVLKQALSGKEDVARILTVLANLEAMLENHHRQVMDDRATDRDSHAQGLQGLGTRLDALASGHGQIMGMLGSRRTTEQGSGT